MNSLIYNCEQVIVNTKRGPIDIIQLFFIPFSVNINIELYSNKNHKILLR